MLCGIHAIPVQVEVDISTGLPAFEMVGYLSSEVREAKERVRTALHNITPCQTHYDQSLARKYKEDRNRI